jgi:sulfur relay protein TusB/DsrH
VKPRPESRKTCLHLVAGAGREALDDCLSHSDTGDALLFLDAGVLHLLRHGITSTATSLAGPAAVYSLSADLRAQGLLELAGRLGVSVIDDGAFGELLAAHDHCLTWT